MHTDPFFIVGSDRSGTTLLRLMLNAHSRLRVPRESHWIPDLIAALPLDRPLSSEEVERAYQLMICHEWWPQWEPTSETLHATLQALDRPRLAEIVDAAYRQANNPAGKPRWGDKTPIYVREMQKLHALFPEAQFIHVVRDGRDVCLSLRRQQWWGRNWLKWAYYWTTTVHRGRTAGAALGPSRYLEVRYEDLVLAPEATLQRICAFLGEPYEAGMLAYHETAQAEIAPGEGRIHAKTNRPPQAADVERWRRELPAVATVLVELVAGPGLDAAGYRRRFPRLAPLSRLVAALRQGLGPVVRPLRDRLVTQFPGLRQHM